MWIKRCTGTKGCFVARCRFCDFDGVTRWIWRAAPTKAAASRALQDEIRTRSRSVATAPLRPEHTFERAAELWLVKLDVP